jgi:hypothetical protein
VVRQGQLGGSNSLVFLAPPVWASAVEQRKVMV